MRVYVIGSLRNPNVVAVANRLRDAGFNVFDDWMASGEKGDEYWQQYEQARGRGYVEALSEGEAAEHQFGFDKRHLEAADVGVLVYPAGKSAHMELGWMLGKGKKGYILLDQVPERWDLMLKLADGVFTDMPSLIDELKWI